MFLRLSGVSSRTPSPSPGAGRSTRPGNPTRTARARRPGQRFQPKPRQSSGRDRREPHREHSRTSISRSPNATALAEDRQSTKARLRPVDSLIAVLAWRQASYFFILPSVSPHVSLSGHLPNDVRRDEDSTRSPHQVTTTKQRSRWPLRWRRSAPPQPTVTNRAPGCYRLEHRSLCHHFAALPGIIRQSRARWGTHESPWTPPGRTHGTPRDGEEIPRQMWSPAGPGPT